MAGATRAAFRLGREVAARAVAVGVAVIVLAVMVMVDVAVPLKGNVPTSDAVSVTRLATDECAGMLYWLSCGSAVSPAPLTSKS